jgi:hypothetical protein
MAVKRPSWKVSVSRATGKSISLKRRLLPIGILGALLALSVLAGVAAGHVGQEQNGNFKFYFRGTTFSTPAPSSFRDQEDPVNIIFYGGGQGLTRGRMDDVISNHDINPYVRGSDSYMVWTKLNNSGAQQGSVQNVQAGTRGAVGDRYHFRLWNDHHHTVFTCPGGNYNAAGCTLGHGNYNQWWVGSVHYDTLVNNCPNIFQCDKPGHDVIGDWAPWRSWLVTTMLSLGHDGTHQCVYPHWRLDPGAYGVQSNGGWNDGWISRISMRQWTTDESVCDGNGA